MKIGSDVHYLDTSALVKMLVPEGESAALLAWWASVGGEVATSALTRTELLRAARRRSPGHVPAAASLLSSCLEIGLDRQVLDRAGSIEPALLRSLDAIHLASAELLGSDLQGLVTYDQRMAEAAEALGMTVVTPV